MLCGKPTACGIAKTDVNGEFIFRSLSPGTFSMRVRLRGFYPVEQFDLAVRQGQRLVYMPVYLERCRRGNCGPKLRPKKPLVICE